MSSVKRILGDYTISSVGTGNITFNTNTVTINGSLDVNGGITYIDTTELSILDPFISLNKSNTAAFASNGGVLVHKTSSDFAGIRYNNTASRWEVSTSTASTGDTGTWVAVATAGTAAGNVTTGTATRLAYYAATGSTVVDTGANLTWNGSNLLTVGGNINATNLQSNSQIVVTNSSSTVTGQSGHVVIAANTASNGGSGLFVNNASKTDELVSKTKARKFAIIFG